MLELLLFGLALLVGGAVSSGGYFLDKKEAKKFNKSVESVKGYVGIAVLVIGIIALIWSFTLLGGGVFLWLAVLVPVILVIANGTLLSYSLIAQYALNANKEKKKKAEELIGKLERWQTPLGLMAIGLGLSVTLLSFVSIAKIIQWLSGMPG